MVQIAESIDTVAMLAMRGVLPEAAVGAVVDGTRLTLRAEAIALTSSLASTNAACTRSFLIIFARSTGAPMTPPSEKPPVLAIAMSLVWSMYCIAPRIWSITPCSTPAVLK